MKTRSLRWNENYGIQESGIENFKGKIIIYENYVTEHYDQLEHLEIETEGEVDVEERSL